MIRNIIHSYRFEWAIGTKKLQSISLKNKVVIYEKMISAVDIHRKAMELVFVF